MKHISMKLAAVCLAAGFCLSAQSAPSNSEVAMSKCTKEGPASAEKKCHKEEDCNTCGKKSDCSSTNYSDQQSDACETVKSRKSAAQKVVDGE
ncbi:MAG: hypothetical protein JSS32_00265 [Verrucomicrobia bacterium]|nr:hypothetical protein [Verrucomicrobiota bacterium]